MLTMEQVKELYDKIHNPKTPPLERASAFIALNSTYGVGNHGNDTRDKNDEK